MNLYRLFTATGQIFWVRANTSDNAIRFVESSSKQRVSCWFIGGTPMPYSTVHTAGGAS